MGPLTSLRLFRRDWSVSGRLAIACGDRRPPAPKCRSALACARLGSLYSRAPLTRRLRYVPVRPLNAPPRPFARSALVQGALRLGCARVVHSADMARNRGYRFCMHQAKRGHGGGSAQLRLEDCHCKLSGASDRTLGAQGTAGTISAQVEAGRLAGPERNPPPVRGRRRRGERRRLRAVSGPNASRRIRRMDAVRGTKGGCAEIRRSEGSEQRDAPKGAARSRAERVRVRREVSGPNASRRIRRMDVVRGIEGGCAEIRRSEGEGSRADCAAIEHTSKVRK